MTPDFDPTADAVSNYTFAVAMLRLALLLEGSRHPEPDEPVELVLWADLMRARGRR